jgi:hypothetical protein
MKRMTLAIFATLLTMASTTFAATQATNTNTVAPTLQISATIQKAVSLTLATGTAAATHCAVTATGASPDYTMSFGTVDALGINNGSCNLIKPAVPGTDNAIYWTDYQLTPVYTSQSVATSTVTAQVTTNFAASNIFVVRSATATSNTLPAVATDFAAMGTASADTIVASSGTNSGTAFTRFIGVAVKPDNGGTAGTGAQTATVTFTLTVQ